jgi:hypothetical protein
LQKYQKDNQKMKDWNIKKAAKILIKRAKQNPKMYAKAEVWYAKMIKKREHKNEKRQFENKSE